MLTLPGFASITFKSENVSSEIPFHNKIVGFGSIPELFFTFNSDSGGVLLDRFPSIDFLDYPGVGISFFFFTIHWRDGTSSLEFLWSSGEKCSD